MLTMMLPDHKVTPKVDQLIEFIPVSIKLPQIFKWFVVLLCVGSTMDLLRYLRLMGGTTEILQVYFRDRLSLIMCTSIFILM